MVFGNKLRGGSRRVYNAMKAGASIRFLKGFGGMIRGAVLVDDQGGRPIRLRHARKAIRRLGAERKAGESKG